MQVKNIDFNTYKFTINNYTIKVKYLDKKVFLNAGDLAKCLNIPLGELQQVLYNKAACNLVKEYNYVNRDVLKYFDDPKYDNFIWTVIENIVPYLNNFK